MRRYTKYTKNKRAGIEINKTLALLLSGLALIVIILILPVFYKAKIGNDFAVPCGEGSYSTVSNDGSTTCNQCPKESKCDIYQSKLQCEQDSCKTGCRFDNNKCVKV